jgi:hypothetical protein
LGSWWRPFDGIRQTTGLVLMDFWIQKGEDTPSGVQYAMKQGGTYCRKACEGHFPKRLTGAAVRE